MRLQSVLLCGCLMSGPALGADLFAFHRQGLCPETGALIHVGKDDFVVLHLDGSQRHLLQREVIGISLFRTVENPFARLFSAQPIVEPFRVEVTGGQNPFVGYATYFLPHLVFFADAAGKTRVVEMEEFVSVRKESMAFQSENPPSFVAPTRLVMPEQFETPAHCTPPQTAPAVTVSAHRVISNSLHIASFFEDMRDGYENLAKLVERAQFYPRPVVLGGKSRLGFASSLDIHSKEKGIVSGNLASSLPVYIESGGGSPYGYQGYFKGGYGVYEQVPSFERSFGFSTSFKAHALHGSLVGNLAGLAAGKPIYDSLYQPPSSGENFPYTSFSSFNHMTLLGVDYRSFSLSYGNSYPVFAIIRGVDFREIVSTDGSPVLRMGYMAGSWDVENFFTYTKAAGDTGFRYEPNVYDLWKCSSRLCFRSAQFIPNKVRFRAVRCRTNFHLQVNPDVLVGSSLLLGQNRYEEDVQVRTSTATSSGPSYTISKATHSAKISTVGFSAFARMDFGQWVALRFEGFLSRDRMEGSISDAQGSSNSDHVSLVGALEVLL